MTSSQVNISETPPMSANDLEGLKDENGLYAGKFKSVEDLVGSYKELEGKLGAIDQTREEPEGVEEETEQQPNDSEFDAEEYYGDGLASVLEEVGIDPQDISDRFMENDEISEDDYSKLGEAGFSRQVIDTYLDGIRNASVAGEVDAQGIKDSVGGDESYSQMVSWAIDNLPAEDVQAFNKLTDTGDGPAIKLAVQGIYSQYNNAMGVEPNLYSGRPAASGPTPYRSTAEVKAAMSDPRYGKDVTYTESVYSRLENSDVFG
tara:strand:- start:46 stop:828 length:783 start_codon:yes stop_codon:yes gene_type:complete